MIVLAVANLDAVLALPAKEALIVAGNLSVASPPPLTETAAPVLVPSESAILIFLAVPQFTVVISAEPSKLVPLIFLAVANFMMLIRYQLYMQSFSMKSMILHYDFYNTFFH